MSMISARFKRSLSNQIREAKQLYKKKNYKEAVQKFIDILKKRYKPDIACYLGKCYLLGRGIAMNPKKAVDLFYEASMHKYIPAYYCLAKYQEIQYLADDYLYVRTNAQLADFLRKMNNMMTYFKKAALKGHKESCYKLAQCYLHPPLSDSNQMHKALKWYKLAAQKGHVMAMIDLSWCYARGKGVRKDMTKAKYWRNKALARKNSKNKLRKFDIGDIIIDPKTGKQDIVLHHCTCNKYINCAFLASGPGFVSNEFGSRRRHLTRPCYNSNICHIKISDVKIFAQKYPANEWKFK